LVVAPETPKKQQQVVDEEVTSTPAAGGSYTCKDDTGVSCFLSVLKWEKELTSRLRRLTSTTPRMQIMRSFPAIRYSTKSIPIASKLLRE
jgi:hypothetical protein